MVNQCCQRVHACKRDQTPRAQFVSLLESSCQSQILRENRWRIPPKDFERSTPQQRLAEAGSWLKQQERVQTIFTQANDEPM
jgi:hypothetical protein